jgi:hypothetical protein
MTNLINYTLSMRIKDDENWPDDDEYANRSVSGVIQLDDSTPSREILDIGRCGGEVRVEARYTFSRAAGGAINVNGTLRLYEGTSDSSSDLDGTATVSGTISANGGGTLARRVDNTDEGGDWADVTLTVSNSLLNQNDPCANIDAKASALGAAFVGAAQGPCEAVRGGHRRRYAGCDIYYSPTTGAHEVHGDIRAKYNAKGGPDSDLFLPVTDETTTPDGIGRYNHFSGNGSIYWHPQTGPMEVRGGIRGVWAAQGWERGGIGYPTSDEMLVKQSPAQWFSDFQNGVVFWQENAKQDLATATLSRGKVLEAFDRAFRQRVTDGRVDIQSVSIVGVSPTGYDFWRSVNRSITFRISGEVRSGLFFIPDPNWWVEMPIRLEATPAPNAQTKVEIRVIRSGAARIHADNLAGIGTADTVAGIKTAIENGFSAPIKLADVPAEAGLLSAKVMPDGGVTLFFRPDLVGRFAAFAAQQALDNIQL